MNVRKSYGQFCGLARALDHVGDRWTLLVVRELLLGPSGFTALSRSLAGISPNLLVERLRRLVADGLVERSPGPPRSKSVVYALTADGRALEPVVHELIRWGARWMTSGPGTDRIDARWVAVALSALLDGAPTSTARGVVHLSIDDEDVTIELRGDDRVVRRGAPSRADASLEMAASTALALASGQRALRSGDVRGDVSLARAALSSGNRAAR